jgi:Family of unknown function (DUF6492)
MNSTMLSFVLPVALTEEGAPLDRGLAWRSSPDSGARERTRLLLRTFVKHFDLRDLAEFLIVTPDNDFDEVVRLVTSVTCDHRFTVMRDSYVCPTACRVIDQMSKKRLGWFVQQLIKLSVSELIMTSHYVTLDSDIICMRPFSRGDLFENGKALTNFETLHDYKCLYTEGFALREFQAKTMRFLRSARILRSTRPPQRKSGFYGETPVVLRTQSVRDMTSYITRVHGEPAGSILARDLSWTEYSLYFQYLELEGSFDQYYQMSTANRLLDLPHSIWQVSHHYREPRNYEIDFFSKYQEKGLFVAIQSWLPVSAWLPKRFESIYSYYRELEAALDVHD